jgi:hypothetical protein
MKIRADEKKEPSLVGWASRSAKTYSFRKMRHFFALYLHFF